MYDPRGKKRDLRRGMGHGFSPHRHWKKLHENGTRSWMTFGHNTGFWANCGCTSWDECRNKEIEFIHNWTGADYWEIWGHSHASADFRRRLNRQYKAKCKAALRKAFIEWDWDNYLPPLQADDADYLWF